MERHPIELRTELHQLQPLRCVPAILLGRVTGHTGGTLVGGGPAFSALESDHNPDALVLSHEGRAPQVRNSTLRIPFRFPQSD